MAQEVTIVIKKSAGIELFGMKETQRTSTFPISPNIGLCSEPPGRVTSRTRDPSGQDKAGQY